MQKCCPKNLIIFFLFLLLGLNNGVSAQISSYRLRQADSLFQIKRYTQSLNHYETIFSQGKYTPAMLLKMAYIEEGLNHTGKALYYLTLYYEATRDKTVLGKMEELAKKNNLEGYQQTDVDWLLGFYHDHHLTIALILTVLIFLAFSMTVFLKRKNRSPWLGFSGMFVLMVFLLIHINIGNGVVTAIIAQDKTLLMDGPSPGAEVVSVVTAGHKVEVIGHHDVWTKITWNGKTAFVKENNLLVAGLQN